jgi:hypothetical protein
MATSGAMEVVDVSAAMDNNPATLIPASPARASVPANTPRSIALSGAYAVVTGGDTSAWDITTPLAPKPVVRVSTSMNTTGCMLAGTDLTHRPAVSLHGSRAYATSWGQTIVFDTE